MKAEILRILNKTLRPMPACADERQKVFKNNRLTNTWNIGYSLRARGNRGYVSERVRRKSNRFLLEITAIIAHVGLRWRRILTLRSEGAEQRFKRICS